MNQDEHDERDDPRVRGERKAFALHDRPHEQPHHDRVEQQIAHERTRFEPLASLRYPSNSPRYRTNSASASCVRRVAANHNPPATTSRTAPSAAARRVTNAVSAATTPATSSPAAVCEMAPRIERRGRAPAIANVDISAGAFRPAASAVRPRRLGGRGRAALLRGRVVAIPVAVAIRTGFEPRRSFATTPSILRWAPAPRSRPGVRRIPRRHAESADEQCGIGVAQQRHRVGYGQHRRRVDQHDVEAATKLVEDLDERVDASTAGGLAGVAPPSRSTNPAG